MKIASLNAIGMIHGAEEDISDDLSPPLGNDVTTTCFIYARHGNNFLNRRS